MKRIVLIRGFYPNPRCVKRLDAIEGQYELTLIYWQKKATDERMFEHTGVKTEEIAITANWTNPMKRLLPYRMFWNRCMRLLMKEQPDIIWTEAIDMLEIACAYKSRVDRNVKIVYEVADLHRYLIDKPRNLLMWGVREGLRGKEKRDCRQIDLLILTSEKYYETYFSRFVPSNKMLFMPNMPELHPLKSYNSKNHSGKMTIGYIGVIRYIKQAELLVAAANEADWNVLFAGNEIGDKIKTLTDGMENITYIGRFDFNTQIAESYGQCDVIYSVYDADMANVRVALPNKLYEAIWCEVPIIVAKNTYLAELVETWGVGVAVDHQKPDELTAVLSRLRTDCTFYQMLCDNCKKHKSSIDLESYNQVLKKRLEMLL